MNQQLRATAAMIQATWPGRWEGSLAQRLEQLMAKNEQTAGDDNGRSCTRKEEQ